MYDDAGELSLSPPPPLSLSLPNDASADGGQSDLGGEGGDNQLFKLR